jgi:hypothetical protein
MILASIGLNRYSMPELSPSPLYRLLTSSKEWKTTRWKAQNDSADLG